MRSLIKVSLFFIVSLSISAQSYQAGAGFCGGLPNDNVKASNGFDFFLEYVPESLLFFRTSGGFAITKFSDSSPYLYDVKYSLYWIEGSLMHMLIKSKTEAYVGIGIGYYIINTEDFNEIKTETGNYIPQEFSSKVSYHLRAGLSYPMGKSTKLHFQAKYLFLKENLAIDGEELVDDKILRNSSAATIDLSTLFVTAGIIFKI